MLFLTIHAQILRCFWLSMVTFVLPSPSDSPNWEPEGHGSDYELFLLSKLRLLGHYFKLYTQQLQITLMVLWPYLVFRVWSPCSSELIAKLPSVLSATGSRKFHGR